jgi:hypothetical protein
MGPAPDPVEPIPKMISLPLGSVSILASGSCSAAFAAAAARWSTPKALLAELA